MDTQNITVEIPKIETLVIEIPSVCKVKLKRSTPTILSPHTDISIPFECSPITPKVDN
jgi:hypothetical protein